MTDNKKNLIKAKTKLKVYKKILKNLTEVLDEEYEIDDLCDELEVKILNLTAKVNSLTSKEEVNDEVTNKYGPRDKVNYRNASYKVMEVHHENKSYKLRAENGDDIIVYWGDVN
jgi:hypothetical protein